MAFLVQADDAIHVTYLTMFDAMQQASDDGSDEGQDVRKRGIDREEEGDAILTSSCGQAFRTHSKHLWSSS